MRRAMVDLLGFMMAAPQRNECEFASLLEWLGWEYGGSADPAIHTREYYRLRDVGYAMGWQQRVPPHPAVVLPQSPGHWLMRLQNWLYAREVRRAVARRHPPRKRKPSAPWCASRRG